MSNLVDIENKFCTCGLDEGEEAENDTGEDEQREHRLEIYGNPK